MFTRFAWSATIVLPVAVVRWERGGVKDGGENSSVTRRSWDNDNNNITRLGGGTGSDGAPRALVSARSACRRHYFRSRTRTCLSVRRYSDRRSTWRVVVGGRHSSSRSLISFKTAATGRSIAGEQRGKKKVMTRRKHTERERALFRFKCLIQYDNNDYRCPAASSAMNGVSFFSSLPPTIRSLFVSRRERSFLKQRFQLRFQTRWVSDVALSHERWPTTTEYERKINEFRTRMNRRGVRFIRLYVSAQPFQFADKIRAVVKKGSSKYSRFAADGVLTRPW